jgi:hypothetical protein
MPLFGNRKQAVVAPPPQKTGIFGRNKRATTPPLETHTTSTAPRRSSGLFGRNKRTTTPPIETSTTAPRTSGIFGRNRSNSPPTTGHHSTGGLLHRHEDASIAAARTRVMQAETAERDADRALLSARAAVRDARHDVKKLETEAAEEARLAKLKQSQAAHISKRAKPLGRKLH